MERIVKPLVFSALIAFSSLAFAQDPQVSPDAPQDRPISATSPEVEALDAAIAPYVAEAKRTYPVAREKFAEGLPNGQSFFVVTRLYDGSGAFEQVFIAVRKIDDGVIYGKVWSEISRVRGFTLGDPYQLAESELLDWLITHPDGSEEGNFVGKFLDSYGSNGS
jgi:hypothetical protein